MTENGRSGPSPQVLAALRGEDPYGHIPQPGDQYMVHPSGRVEQQKRGFTAGDTWDGVWSFTHYGGDAGTTPMPTQERIANFRRRGAEFMIEAQRLAHEAQKAQAKTNEERRKAAEKAIAEGKDYVEPFSAKKALKDVEETEAEEKRLYDQMRDFTAEFCAGSPTREQLERNVLPDHEFLRYVNYLAEQISPNG